MKTLILLLSTLSLLLSANPAFAAEQLDLATVLQRINQHYPTLQMAAQQVVRAKQDVIAAQSQLAWTMSANAGISHDLGAFNTITNTTNLGLSINKPLASGSSLSVSTSVSNQNIDNSTLSSQMANFIADPQQNTSVELSYRMALGKGNGNPLYHQSLENSKAGVMMSQASERGTRDQVGNQVIELFYGVAQAQAALISAREGLRRAEAMVAYIKNNMRLGLAEEKDYLQFDAQLRAARVQLKNAELMWSNQRTSLNRLMGQPWDQDFELVVHDSADATSPGYEPLLKKAEDHSPDLLRHQAELIMADAAIDKARNDKENQFDIVASIGDKSISATYPTSTVNQSGTSYGVNVVYGLSFDKSGFDAKLYQAQIDKGLAQQNILQTKQDLQYNLNSMLTAIQASRQALELSQRHLEVEQERYADVKKRFKSGRVDNSQLIMAEGDLSAGEFDLKQRQIDLAKREAQLDALSGKLWQLQQ